MQVDFRKEARHLQEFSAYLDASGMRAVATCPYVYKALSTQRCAVVLTGTAGYRRDSVLCPCWQGLEHCCRGWHTMQVVAGNLAVIGRQVHQEACVNYECA